MTKRLSLSAMQHNTQYAPLAALGYFLRQRDFFAPLREHVKVGSKTRLHTPHQELLAVVISMLGEYTSIKHTISGLTADTGSAGAARRGVGAHIDHHAAGVL